MSQPLPISRRSRSRHHPYRRWSADEKTAYLDAFRQSGRSTAAFCRQTGVSPATLAFWKREARLAAREAAPSLPRSRVAFARVAVVPAEPPMGESRGGMRLIVRGAAGYEAALDGVDGPTAVQLVALVLGGRR